MYTLEGNRIFKDGLVYIMCPAGTNGTTTISKEQSFETAKEIFNLINSNKPTAKTVKKTTSGTSKPAPKPRTKSSAKATKTSK